MIYKFEKFEINTYSHSFSAAGVEQKVQPKVYDLILFLIENRQRAISKDEIQDQIWPNVEVTETAMTRAIMKARKLLDDKGEIIKTVHGHGYHFIAEVEVIKDVERHTNKTSKKPAFYVLALVVLLALVFMAFLFKSDYLPSEHTKVAVLPIIDQTNQPDLAWAGLGLMSLSTQMFKANSGIETISSWKTAKTDMTEFPENLNLTKAQIEKLTKELECSHIILAKLSTNESGKYLLDHKVYHPKGKAEFSQITGDNPTAMVQKMTKEIIASLPGSPTDTIYRVISEDVFTNELYSRGMGYQIMGDAKKAKDYFKLAADEDPSLFWPRYELALTTRKLGLAKESEQELLQLETELPELTDEPEAQIALANAIGLAKMRLGENDAALEYLIEGFEISAEHNNLEHQKVLASNVALIYKRQGKFNKAKSWIAKSIDINTQQGNPDYGVNTYLLAQIEEILGNNETALKLLDEAISLYERDNMQRFIAAALATKSRIYRRQGYWQKSQEILDESIEIKKAMSDNLAVISGNLDQAYLFIEEGKYSDTLALIPMIEQLIQDIENTTMIKHLKRIEVILAFEMEDYETAKTLIASMAPNEFNSDIRKIDLKLKYLAGDKDSIDEYIKEFESNNTTTLSQSKSVLRLINLKLFKAQQENETSVISELLPQKVEFSRSLGRDAEMARAMIALAEIHIASNEWSEVHDILNNLSLLQLNWWEINLLKAYYMAFAQNDLAAAKELAQLAKNSSTEKWDDSYQNRYIAIMECCDTN